MPDVASVPSAALLSTRRALLGDPLSIQVHDWLRALYIGPIGLVRTAASKGTAAAAVSIVTKMVTSVDPMLKKETALHTALQGASTFIAAPMPATYATAFAAVKHPASSALGTFISVVYARATVLMMSSPNAGSKVLDDLKTTLGNPSAAIEKYVAAQKKLDPNFVGHLVTYAEIERQIDPHFEKVLQRAASFFLKAHRPNAKAPSPFADPKHGLDQLKLSDQAAWYQLPATVAFAMTIAS